MSYADQVFIQNCQDILSRGVWDTDREVRPRWEDGTPAHTIKLFGVVNRYDLRREFPILTGHPKDSTEQESLMKPYYLDI